MIYRDIVIINCFYCIETYRIRGLGVNMGDRQIWDLPTPSFIVDRSRVEGNCSKLRNTCERLGVQLRSMTKTHKCV